MLRYGIPSLLLIGSLLIGVFYLKPAWDNFQQIRADTNHLRDLSVEFDGLIQDRDALIAKLNLVSASDLARIESLIPQGPHSLDYLIALQQAAQQSNIGLTFTRADINPPQMPESAPSSVGQPAGTSQPQSGSAATPAPPQMLNPVPSTQSNNAGIRDIPVGIAITGSYGQLKQFMDLLEHFGRLTDIAALALVAPSGDQGTQSFTFTLNLITHYQ